MNLCQRCKLDAENIVHGHLSMSVVPDEKCETWAHKELRLTYIGLAALSEQQRATQEAYERLLRKVSSE